jgi:hypothetical protein
MSFINIGSSNTIAYTFLLENYLLENDKDTEIHAHMLILLMSTPQGEKEQ